MAFFEQDELNNLYKEAKSESTEWRRDYPEYERLADNGLLEDLDETLPETNSGDLAAGLFKLPKRVVRDDLTGRFQSLDADDAWVTELANIYWENEILPNANSQAPYKRKIKDVVRKAAIYGSQPVISLLVDHGNKVHADFIVPYVQDVRLEPGKVSDADSDIIFWDVYYSRKQLRDLIEQAKEETKENPLDGYNKWDAKALQAIYDANMTEEERDSNEDHITKDHKSVKRGGVKFCIAFQRGIAAPFYMYHHSTNKVVREWENPDPTGDIPVKYLYCYQDFNNPYGIGIVKLAGGTQNVLDIMRKYDVLATQIGIRPPKIIQGNEDDIDEDSMVYAQDANWYVGQANVTPYQMANGVYNELPTRVQMYQSSLNKIMPMGDSTVSASAGDPLQSKTPAGVKAAQASLSVDDEDFKDNVEEWFEQVAKNLINLTFANMQGRDLLKLNDDERDLLQRAGLEFPVNELGEPSNELEIIWDEARSTFDFKMDAEDDKAKDEEKRLEGLLRVMELRQTDPMLDQKLAMNGKKFNDGELITSVISLTTDNDKIIQDVAPEDEEAMQQEQMMAEQGIDPTTGQPLQPQDQEQPIEQPEEDRPLTVEEAGINVDAVMQEYGVDQETAAEMLMMEEQGVPAEEIKAAFEAYRQDQEMTNA